MLTDQKVFNNATGTISKSYQIGKNRIIIDANTDGTLKFARLNSDLNKEWQLNFIDNAVTFPNGSKVTIDNLTGNISFEIHGENGLIKQFVLGSDDLVLDDNIPTSKAIISAINASIAEGIVDIESDIGDIEGDISDIQGELEGIKDNVADADPGSWD